MKFNGGKYTVKREYGYIFFFAAASFLIFWHPFFFEKLNWKFYDFEIRHLNPVQVSKHLLLVKINRFSVQKYGPWPFPPKVYLKFVQTVEKGKPAAIGFDILFQAASLISKRVFHKFLHIVNHFGNLFFAVSLNENGTLQPPLKSLTQINCGFGFIGVIMDPDGRVRRISLLYPTKSEPIPSLPLILVGAYHGYLKKIKPVFKRDGRFDWWVRKDKEFVSRLKFSPDVPFHDRQDYSVIWRALKIPDATRRSDMFIFYRINLSKITIPLSSVLEGKVPPARFKKKIILLYSSAAASDTHFTPLSKGREIQDKVPGGEILGYALNTILTGAFITHESVLGIFISILFLLSFLLLLLRFGIIKGGVFSLFVLIFAVLFFYYLFLRDYDFIGPADLLISSAVFYSGCILTDRLRLGRSLRIFLPEKMAQDLEFREIRAGGKEVFGTAMFVDMAGYTAKTEKESLAATFESLQQFHQKVEDLAVPYGGIVCDWQGDGVLILFSDDRSTPHPISNPSQSAVLVALSMKHEFEKYSIDAGIGIASGRVMWGYLGTSRKLQPTAIGDPVNLASRLQGVGKGFGDAIAVDKQTFLETEKYFEWVEHPNQIIKGKVEPVQVYSPKKAL
jgi:adenylate cyclase